MTSEPERSVLIVDENAAARRVVADICRLAGLTHIDHANTNEMAFTRMSERHYTIVLCDWGLGTVVRGVELATQARQLGALAPKSIVLMKVNPSKADALVARAAKAKLLARPFSAQSLINQVRDIFPDLGSGA